MNAGSGIPLANQHTGELAHSPIPRPLFLVPHFLPFVQIVNTTGENLTKSRLPHSLWWLPLVNLKITLWKQSCLILLKTEQPI
jgi:hypothetical protein